MLPVCRVDPRPRAALERLRVVGARVQCRVRVLALPACSGSRATCRSTRPTSPTCRPALAFNTAVSFVTNTNWQSYYPETTVSHLTQCPGPHRAELRVGGGRHRGDGRADPWADPGTAGARSATSGSTSCASRSASCSRSPFVFASLLVAGGVIQNLNGFRRVHTVTGDASRPSRAARSPARSRSSSSAPTAAASSTPTRRTRSRTRRPSPTSSSSTRSLIIPFALAFTFGAHGEGQAPGPRGVRDHDARSVLGAHRGRGLVEVDGNPRLDRRGADQTVTDDVAGREHGGQGAPLRPDRLRHLGGSDHGHVERLRQLDARQLHAARGGVALVHMKLGEVSPGGVGVGPERAPRVRAPVGVHRRAHGRANTRVPGQEDPGVRGQARRALHPGDAGRAARVPRGLHVRRLGAEHHDLQPGPARLHARCCTPTRRRPTTTARRSPGSPRPPSG